MSLIPAYSYTLTKNSLFNFGFNDFSIMFWIIGTPRGPNQGLIFGNSEEHLIITRFLTVGDIQIVIGGAIIR